MLQKLIWQPFECMCMGSYLRQHCNSFATMSDHACSDIFTLNTVLCDGTGVIKNRFFLSNRITSRFVPHVTIQF